ncbi:MAG: bifunctional nuclease family protein [Phycisphaerales bacterium]|nr:bifunctional nuclease family protein [Phycisphaerales bacterium]
MPIQVELSRIFIREMADMQVIELTEVGGSRSFPIVIGLTEACAIERRLKGCEVTRPQTHDLLANIIGLVGATVVRIEIPELKGGTFFAKIVLSHAGKEIEVDARPSDAIALGVAHRAPILVAESVITEAGLSAQGAPPPAIESSDDDDDDDAADDDDDDDDES